MAVNLSPIWGAGAQLLDNSGNVLSGGKIYTYAAGTTTPATTYTSSNGLTANSNPIILNSAGRVPYEIWLTDGVVYKFVLKDSNDTLIATYDNLIGINSNYIAFTMQQEIQTATAGQTVFDLTTMQYQPGTNSLSVFVDGVNQYGPGAQYAYVETDSDTVTFVSGLHEGASVKFTTAASVSSNYANAAQVTYDPPFTGAVATNVQAKLAQTVSVMDFGAVGDGVTDDTAAIQAAIDAVDIGGTVYLFGGVFKTTGEILITKTISLVGEDCRLGNVVNPSLSKSCIYASSITDAAAIRVDNCVATFRNFIVYNNGGAVIVDGIRASGGNNSLKVYDMLIEGFHTGIRCTNGYYNVIQDTSTAYCDTGVRITSCYNFSISALKVRANNAPVYDSETWGIRLLGGSSLNLFASAIENFYTGAIDVNSNASLNMYGTYFESYSTASTSEIIVLGTNAAVVAIGCQVLMTHSKRFITVDSGSSTGVRVFSRNNRLVYPTDTKTVEVYLPISTDQTATWDISGDNWQSPIGVNVTYFVGEGTGGGNSVVQYPPGHPYFLKPVNQKPYVQNTWSSAPTLPVSVETGTVLPTYISFSNNGVAGDDPLGLHLVSWGYNPYMTVYQKGQWEKVGMRLPNQANSTATTVADLVTDFNALLTKMRNNGVMI